MEKDEGGGEVVDCRRNLAVAQLAIGKGAAAGKKCYSVLPTHVCTWENAIHFV